MADDPLLLAIDEGTTSARAIAFDLEGREVASRDKDIEQHFPRPAWVEHDPEGIWRSVERNVRGVLDEVGSERIAGIGLTNQRETVVFWDRRTGDPIGRAIVWQDRRGADLCARLKAEGREPDIQARTGLVLDSYFSASKIAWALEHRPDVREAAEAGRLAIGTIESWLLHRLTEGAVHATDATNASRTLLMDLRSCTWDEELVELFGVPRAALPEIVDCTGPLGETRRFGPAIPITGCAGDQHTAFMGHACLKRGAAKATYGTGGFLLANAGDEPPASRHRLIATVAWRIAGQATYALEGSMFIAGEALKWLKERLQAFDEGDDFAELAASVPDSAGVAFVPALVGLGAPHWEPQARGAITGLTTAANNRHLARACLESMSQQTADLIEAFHADGVAVDELRIGGGMAKNDWLVQDMADTLGIPVERPHMIEGTALGAAMLAGVGAGLFGSLDEASGMRRVERRFEPAADADARRAEGRARWKRALAQVMAGVA